MEKKKRIYVAPAMQVVELKGRQMLLAGSQLQSYQNGGEMDFDEEE